jgi:hypothetical protein
VAALCAFARVDRETIVKPFGYERRDERMLHLHAFESAKRERLTPLRMRNARCFEIRRVASFAAEPYMRGPGRSASAR